MKASVSSALLVATSLVSLSALAQEPSIARPQLVMKNVVSGMPTGSKQEVRVLRASFAPGAKTVFHTHRFPVTVFILEGTFTLELEGRPPVAVKAGEAYVEPPHVRMTGYNRSNTDPLQVVIFYTSDPDTPFLDPIPGAAQQ